MKPVILIPAYNPGPELVDYVRRLSEKDFEAVLVVNDGSAAAHAPIFNGLALIPKVTVIKHATNLGKGMALKTGLNYAHSNFENAIGVVTADADGQHHLDDVLLVAGALVRNPSSLVMGARQFDAKVPARSRWGNTLTKILYRVLIGGRLSDTQSGLRGIPRDLIPKLLKVSSYGYEFELDMLLLCQHNDVPVVEQPIRTIYIEENRSSHFNPLFDSMKIYFVLFRAVIVSLMTVALDTAIFIPLYYVSQHLFVSHSIGRFVGMAFQYSAAKKFVFYSDKENAKAFPQFVLLVATLGAIAYWLMRLFIDRYGIAVPQAKIMAEALIYMIGFTVQRDFIFSDRKTAVVERT